MVVQSEIEKQYYCGGAILTDRFAITVDHCLAFLEVKFKIRDLVVRVGDVNINYGDTYPVEKLIWHKKNNFTQGLHDIALIRTRDSIKFNVNVQPARIRQEYLVGGEGAILSSFGSPKYTDNLYLTAVETITNEECRTMNSDNKEYIRKSILCTTRHNGADHEECGSPLTVAGQLVGLYSYMDHLVTDSSPDIYVRVYDYVDWINREAVL